MNQTTTARRRVSGFFKPAGAFRYRPLTAVVVAAAIFVLGACSNYLSDPLTDPDLPRINDGTPILEPVFSGDVGEGEVTSFSTVHLTVTWPEPVDDFDVADIIPENCGVAGFDGSGDSYSFDLLMTAEGTVSFTIPARSVSGISGNTNPETIFSFARIAAGLTLSITSDDAPQTSSDTISVDFTFSEDVSGFDDDDISVTNGTISPISGSGDSYSASFTFDGDGIGSIAVPTAAALDTATGQKENSPDVLSVIYDSSLPSVTFDAPISEGDIAGYNSLVFGIVFSEPVTGFNVADLAVDNALLSDFTGSEDTYSVRLTAQDDGDVTLQVPAGVGFDAAGNGNLISDEFVYTYDSSTVAVNFQSSENDPSNAVSATVDIVFDLPMGDFVETDLTAVNSVLSGFSDSGDGMNFSVIVSPSGDGDTGFSISGAAALSLDGDHPNVASEYSFLSDRTAPDQPDFEVKGYDTDDVVSAGETIGEFLYIDLTTVYTDDTGSSLSYQYSTDSGATWNTFVDLTPLTAQGAYSGINLRVSDAAGNSTDGIVLENVTIDTTPPDAPLPAITTDPVNVSNDDSFGFSITGGEANADLEYTILSDSGTPANTGDDQVLTGSPFTGSCDASGHASFSDIDVSSLADGSLTVRVRQTDAVGNTGGWGQDSVVKDTVLPSSPTVTILSADPITSSGNESFAFEVSGGEEGATWEYEISSDGGGPAISDSGVFSANGTVGISGVDVSALRDGILTVSVVQEDPAENVGPAGSDSVTLDATAVNIIDLPDFVDVDNQDAVPIILTAEVDSTYSYVISSSNGGDSDNTLGSGSYGDTGQVSFSPDLSGLNDGWIVIIVNVTDVRENTSSEYAVVKKEAAGQPSTDTADFSTERAAFDEGDIDGVVVDFDVSYHGYQSMPDAGYVRYDTTDIIGSKHDDIFRFSALEADEAFTLDGGTGFNTIDLSNYLSDDVTIDAGAVSEDAGTITVDLGTGSATITYDNVSKFIFSANNFTGSPHSLELDTSNGTRWLATGVDIELWSPVPDVYQEAVIGFEGSLDINYELSTESFINTGVTPYEWENAVIIFDYHDVDNYKFIRAHAGGGYWSFNEVAGGELEERIVMVSDSISVGIDWNLITLKITGAEGKTAEIYSSGVFKLSHEFDDPLNDGSFGISGIETHTDYVIDMTPSNWAPYARNYDKVLVKPIVSDITMDLLGDAVDAEGESLTLGSISSSVNGTLLDNGDGTVTYTPNGTFLGVDEFTYVISDGINSTEGQIRIDVMP